MIAIEDIRKMIEKANLLDIVAPDYMAEDELNLDSMSHILLITELENYFHVKIDYRTVDLDNFSSLKKIQIYLSSLSTEKMTTAEAGLYD